VLGRYHTGAATVVEVVEGQSAPPPEAFGGSGARREEARGALIAARTRERRAQDERDLMDRMWETMISGAVGGGGGGGVGGRSRQRGGGTSHVKGSGGSTVGGGAGVIAGELDALAASGWDSLETLMQRRRETLARLDDEVDAARAAVVTTLEAFSVAEAAAAGRRWVPDGGGGGGRGRGAKYPVNDGRRQVRIVLEGTTAAAVASSSVDLKLSYLTYGAHWSPSYDCRAHSTTAGPGAGVEEGEDKDTYQDVTNRKHTAADATTAGAGQPSLALTYYGRANRPNKHARRRPSQGKIKKITCTGTFPEFYDAFM